MFLCAWIHSCPSLPTNTAVRFELAPELPLAITFPAEAVVTRESGRVRLTLRGDPAGAPYLSVGPLQGEHETDQTRNLPNGTVRYTLEATTGERGSSEVLRGVLGLGETSYEVECADFRVTEVPRAEDCLRWIGTLVPSEGVAPATGENGGSRLGVHVRSNRVEVTLAASDPDCPSVEGESPVSVNGQALKWRDRGGKELASRMPLLLPPIGAAASKSSPR